MEKYLKIGVVVKPQGIKGELKVIPYTDDISRFKKLKHVVIDGQTYNVTGAKIGVDAVFLSIFGVGDRNTAETFRNKELFVERKDAIIPSENSYFIVDIIGSTVMNENGEKVGVVTDVTNAKTDIFTIDCSGKTMRFPFLKDLLVKVEIENKLIVVNSKRLGEVACYED